MPEVLANSGRPIAIGERISHRPKGDNMNNTKRLASHVAGALAIVTLMGTSAFAETRHWNATNGDRGQQSGDRRDDLGRNHSSDRSDARSNTQPDRRDQARLEAQADRNADRGRTQPEVNRNADRGRTQPEVNRSADRGRTQPDVYTNGDRGRTQSDVYSNGDRGRSQSDVYRNDDRGSQSDVFSNDDRGRRQSDVYRNGDHRSTQSDAYRNGDRGRSRSDGYRNGNNERSQNYGNRSNRPAYDSRGRRSTSIDGRISHFSHERGGYRVWFDHGRFPLWIPDARLSLFPHLRIGLSLRVGGYYDPLGYVEACDYYDDYGGGGYGAGPYSSYGGGGYGAGPYSSGLLRGVVETIDYRRGTMVLRDDVSGNFVTAIIRDRRLESLRPGDYAEISGNWTRGGVFEALRLEDAGGGRY